MEGLVASSVPATQLRWGVTAWDLHNSSATPGETEAFREEAPRSSLTVLTMTVGYNLRGMAAPWGQVYGLSPRDLRRSLQSPRAEPATEGNYSENC